MTSIRPRPLLLGHRGTRAVKSIRENTLESFDHALADGCDGFEFDVRPAGDGSAVIWHDAEADGIEIARAAAEQLPQLARLEDVLSRYHERAFLDIELKVGGLEQIVAGLLRKYSPRKGFVVSSFLPEVLHAVHAADSGIPLGLICETKAELRRWRELSVGYVIPRLDLLSRELADELKSAQKKIFVWTVNDVDDMRRFRDWRVEGIISDDTELLSKTLGA